VNVRFLPALIAAAALAASTPKEGQMTQPSTVAPVPPSATARAIVGQIVSVEKDGSAVQIRESVSSASQKGQLPVRRTVTLQINAATTIVRGKSPVAASDLKPMDHVVARYVETPTGAIAQSIRAADVVARTPSSSQTGPPSAETPATATPAAR